MRSSWRCRAWCLGLAAVAVASAWTHLPLRLRLRLHFRYLNPRTGQAAWPFDAPQYLLLNVAIGGDLGGAVDERIFPVTLEIDHVRVYQLAK